MIRRPPRSTLSSSSAASDVYKRQVYITSGHDWRVTCSSHIMEGGGLPSLASECQKADGLHGVSLSSIHNLGGRLPDLMGLAPARRWHVRGGLVCERPGNLLFRQFLTTMSSGSCTGGHNNKLEHQHQRQHRHHHHHTSSTLYGDPGSALPSTPPRVSLIPPHQHHAQHHQRHHHHLQSPSC